MQARAAQAIEIAKRNNWLLDIALDHLSLGRAYFLEVDPTPARNARVPSPKSGRGPQGRGFEKAAHYLDQAVDGLRQSGQQDELPRGLLARATLHRTHGAFERAQRDLDEAMTIAARGGMRLHETDAHLEYARLYLAIADLGGLDAAREHLAKAKVLVADTGYHRRDEEVTALEAQLK